MKARVFALLVLGLSGCSGSAIHESPPGAPGSTQIMRASRAEWARSIRRIPLAGAGCYTASYPSMVWLRVDCSTERLAPEFSPRIKSNGDFSAYVRPHVISSAIGSFPEVSGVTNVRSTNAGNDSGSGSYSLQLNSQFFATSACGGLKGCLGWVQFVYRNTPDHKRGNLEIWDWLVDVSSCPPNAGWHPTGSSGAIDCYQTSQVLHIPNQPIMRLAEMSLTGIASSKGGAIELASGSKMFAIKNAQSDGIVDLSKHWDFAEFNVFGYSTAGTHPSSAKFNAGSSVSVSVEIDDGSTTAPQCMGGYSTTLEINNLTLGAAPSNPSQLQNPSILFNESSPESGTSSCAALAGSG